MLLAELQPALPTAGLQGKIQDPNALEMGATTSKDPPSTTAYHGDTLCTNMHHQQTLTLAPAHVLHVKSIGSETTLAFEPKEEDSTKSITLEKKQPMNIILSSGMNPSQRKN